MTICLHMMQRTGFAFNATPKSINRYESLEQLFERLWKFRNLEKIGFNCNTYFSSCSLSNINIHKENSQQHAPTGQSQFNSNKNNMLLRNGDSLQHWKIGTTFFHSSIAACGVTLPVRNFTTSFQASARHKVYSVISSRPDFVASQACKLKRHGEQKNNPHSIDSSSLMNEKSKHANYFNRRMSNIRLRLLDQNKNIKEKINIQRSKGEGAVRKLRRKLQAQVAQKEDIRTIPNLLTTLRMASAPALAYLVVNDHFGFAFSIFVVAGFTDLLDGYIARNFKNQRTALGTALDPLADKLLISCLTLSLTSAGLIPVPLTVLILSRDAGLIIASFVIRYKTLSPPRTLSRYFDVTHVTAKLFPSMISKVNTGIQLSYVACILASPVFGFVDHPLLQGLMYTTALTTFLSGLDYIITWRRRLKVVKNK